MLEQSQDEKLTALHNFFLSIDIRHTLQKENFKWILIFAIELMAHSPNLNKNLKIKICSYLDDSGPGC